MSSLFKQIEPRLIDFKLKRCPKCGAEAKWIRPMGEKLRGVYNRPPYYGVDRYRVVCTSPYSRCSVSGNSYDTATQAAQHWNWRYND